MLLDTVGLVAQPTINNEIATASPVNRKLMEHYTACALRRKAKALAQAATLCFVKPEDPADRLRAQCRNLAAPTCNQAVGLGVAAFGAHVALTEGQLMLSVHEGR